MKIKLTIKMRKLIILGLLAIVASCSPLDNNVNKPLTDSELLSVIEENALFEVQYNGIREFMENEFNDLSQAKKARISKTTYQQYIQFHEDVYLNTDRIRKEATTEFMEKLNNKAYNDMTYYFHNQQREKYADSIESIMKRAWKGTLKHYKGFSNPWSDKVDNYSETLSGYLYNAEYKLDYAFLNTHGTRHYLESTRDYIIEHARIIRHWEYANGKLSAIVNEELHGEALTIFRAIFYNPINMKKESWHSYYTNNDGNTHHVFNFDSEWNK